MGVIHQIMGKFWYSILNFEPRLLKICLSDTILSISRLAERLSSAKPTRDRARNLTRTWTIRSDGHTDVAVIARDLTSMRAQGLRQHRDSGWANQLPVLVPGIASAAWQPITQADAASQGLRGPSRRTLERSGGAQECPSMPINT